MLVKQTFASLRKEFGFNYIGSVNMTAKHKKATTYDELVYTIYLAPAEMSGYNVCPASNEECRTLCLNESGHNRIDIKNRINLSRVEKTKMFFENRELFVRWVIKEIVRTKAKAESLGFKFSVRLNNTSDINPLSFYVIEDGIKLNLLEIFHDVQFYDYTKVANRIKLMKIYPNYDLTFSYDGYNKDTCLEMLKQGIRVAVVFNEIPKTLWGYEVINGDKYDMRYDDPKNVIVGLKFKKVREKLNKDYKFVIQ